MPEQKTHSGTDRRYRLRISNSAAAPIIAREIEPSMLTTMSPLTDNPSNTIRSRSSRVLSNVIRLSSLFTGTLPAPASAGRVPCFSPHKKVIFFPEDDPWLFPMDVYLEYGRLFKNLWCGNVLAVNSKAWLAHVFSFKPWILVII